MLAATAEDAVAAHSSTTDSAWKLVWTLQEVQACTTDHDLPALTLSLFSSIASFQVKSLQTHSSSNSAMITRSSAQRSSQWTTEQNDEEQLAEYRALVNTDLLFKFFTVPLTNKHMAPRTGTHHLHQLQNPHFHTKFSQHPPDDLPRHLIKRLLHVFKSHVESCWQPDTSLAAPWKQRMCLLCLCLGWSQPGNRRLTPTVWWGCPQSSPGLSWPALSAWDWGLCWGFTAQSTQWGHVERGQFIKPHVYWTGLVL